MEGMRPQRGKGGEDERNTNLQTPSTSVPNGKEKVTSEEFPKGGGYLVRNNRG
jgi:hypothetical protein